MERKLYLKHKGESYKILTITQGANLDIYIFPKNAVHFSRELILGLDFDDQVQIRYESLGGEIHHYSAHSLTGQRHIKLEPNSPAAERTLGFSFKNIERPIPLITMVAVANVESQEVPTSEKCLVIQLPDDVNYLILELLAIPKHLQLALQQSFTVHNEKRTLETINTNATDMRNCTIVVVTRITNHELTDVPNNVVFQQVEGKSVNIVRVEKGTVLAQVSHLVTQ